MVIENEALKVVRLVYTKLRTRSVLQRDGHGGRVFFHRKHTLWRRFLRDLSSRPSSVIHAGRVAPLPLPPASAPPP